jgi:CRISPR-associated protein Csa3
VGSLRDVTVESLELELEEDPRSREAVKTLFPTQESRVVRVPVLVKLVDIDYDGLLILQTIAEGVRRAKPLPKKLGVSRATLQRKLVQLVREGLLSYEKRGRSYIYKPTRLAVMIL